MISLYGGKSVLRLATALTLIAFMPVCLAWPGHKNAGASSDPDKHARKIHRELSRFRPGNYIRLTFTDKSDRTVALDSLEDASFTVTNAETNTRETHTYVEIARVARGKDYIGEGSEGHVRHIKLWVPITIAAVAAGGAIAAAEVH